MHFKVQDFQENFIRKYEELSNISGQNKSGQDRWIEVSTFLTGFGL